MRKLLQLLKSGWCLSLVGVLVLCALVWVGGPWIAVAGRQPLASPSSRLVAMLVLLLAWAIVLVAAVLRQRARSRAMGEAIAGSAAGDDDRDAANAAERAQLESRFREAVKLLRRRGGRRSLYALPWYVVIGPPGSGKSTLVRNSGLEFPLAGRFGKEALRGVGGTRNCDWWFTGEAVFLDTAGRYTTQDSDAAADAGGWSGFLRLLRRFRRERPVDGVLVTMSMSDLLLLDECERDAHAQAVRRRLDELHEQLKVRVPVYLVFTKCDLVAGFGEFFDDLDPAQRAQVWGTTFPAARTLDGSAARGFAQAFNGLLERLDARLVERLHNERDRTRRAAILSFPQQFAAFGDIARDFTEAVFAGSAYGAAPLLRGVYLTSGTQEGTPIDRMMGAVARTFGVDATRVHAPGLQRRTFFVERLLRDVVFAESGFAAGLAGGARRRTGAALAMAATVVCTVGLLAAMTVSHARNARYLADVQAALDARPAVAELSGAATPPQYFALALQRLEALRPVVSAAAAHDGDVPWSMRAGLYQGGAVGGQVRDAYLRELNAALLPGLGTQFRRGLADNAGDLQALYYYLKGYLMLGQPRRADAAELSALAAIEWRRLFPRDPVLQAALSSHFDALLAQPGELRALPLDEARVAQARTTLRAADLSALVYSSLRLGLEARSDDDARLDRALGLRGDVFRRRSGAPLSAPWPALYTQPVFAEQVGGGIEDEVDRFLADDWVLGVDAADALSRARTVRQVAALYEQDYLRTWDALLADLELVPATDLQQASLLAAQVAAPGSPLRLLLDLVRSHTSDMQRMPVAEGAAGVLAAAGAAAGEAAGQAMDAAAVRNLALQTVLGDQDDAAAPAPGQAIEAHFAALNQLTEGAAGSTPLDRALLAVDELGKALLTLPAGGAAGAGPPPQLLLARQVVSQLPPPLDGWLSPLAGGSADLLADGQRAALAGQAREAIGRDCADFVRDRYPFDLAAEAEIPLQDFGELFGQGGRFDRLFRESLASRIDTSAATWRWRDEPGLAVGPPGLPARMQAADRIRRAYFRGGALPEVRFTLRQATLGGQVARVEIDIDGQQFASSVGEDGAMPMTWPGPTPGQASITVYDVAGTRLARITRQGDWALFRLLQAESLSRASETDFTARWSLGGGTVELPVHAASLRNPFLDDTVQAFRCGELA
ncbi:type VI secretion system membrane subunit TssM [Luteimonas sp. BDR2-5]|uniref:type VI secretion system membrane subunit TssM n=1 Tax=Proluteimonas luteida TaxID=2878685 RepID=UPI001E344FEF|nr:type VI secretion system membrane subunit TssM [Luteimonas sp. BDR2-5]MCD9027876.1 type VI secretion system membrane subunit TssM [Luteimonas sp. BDR2-5]